MDTSESTNNDAKDPSPAESLQSDRLPENTEPGASRPNTESPYTSASPFTETSVSRGQTPDASDFYASDDSYSDLRQTPDASDDEANKKQGNLLAVERATKRSRTDSDDYDPQNPAGVRKEKVRKRIAGKVIEKLWSVLDRDSFKSFENLCDMSLNKVLERYGTSPAQRPKVMEAQRVLANHWISERNPRSFLARLSVTKLPPLKSLHVRMKGSETVNYDPLSIDSVLHKKAMCEAYLLAELKQLESLESNFRALQSTYELDSKYLHDFKKTTSSLQAQIAAEKLEKMKQLHLDGIPSLTKNVHLETQPLLGSLSGFLPNKDEEVLLLLQNINKIIDDKREPMRQMLESCDQLDVILSKLNSRN